MAFVNPSSCKCMNSELDLFTLRPTQTSIKEASVVEYHPISRVQNRAPTLTYPEAANNISTRATLSYTCKWKSYGPRYPQSHQSTSYFTGCSRRWTFRSMARLFPAPQTPIHTWQCKEVATDMWDVLQRLSLIHIWRCRRSYACRSRWSPYH